MVLCKDKAEIGSPVMSEAQATPAPGFLFTDEIPTDLPIEAGSNARSQIRKGRSLREGY